MITAACLAAENTSMLVVPIDDSRTFAFALGAVVVEEPGGAWPGEPVKGVVLLKKGASSHGLEEDDGASAEDVGESAIEPDGDGEGP